MFSIFVVPILFLPAFARSNSFKFRKLSDTSIGDPVIPPGWAAVGCYTDTSSERTLRTASTTSLDSMTIASCADFCSTQFGVYPYAGVEFGRECYCDTEIRSPGVLTDDSGCNMPCTGDSTQNCGGPDRVFIASRLPTTTTTTTTSTATPTIKPSVGTWEYKGCYPDLFFWLRVLQHQVTTPAQTVEDCVSTCGAKGYPLAGLSTGGDCWCDVYNPWGAPNPTQSGCTTACANDPSSLCGGTERLALYLDTAATPPNAPECLGAQELGEAYFPREIQAGIVAVNYPDRGGEPITIYATNAVSSSTQAPQLLLTATDTGLSTDDPSFALPNVPYLTSGSPLHYGSPPPVGETPLVVRDGLVPPKNLGYCAQTDPISPAGPFIGFPLLAAEGDVDHWALCTNITAPANGRVDVVYAPVAGHAHYELAECRNVYLQLLLSRR